MGVVVKIRQRQLGKQIGVSGLNISTLGLSILRPLLSMHCMKIKCMWFIGVRFLDSLCWPKIIDSMLDAKYNFFCIMRVFMSKAWKKYGSGKEICPKDGPHIILGSTLRLHISSGESKGGTQRRYNIQSIQALFVSHEAVFQWRVPARRLRWLFYPNYWSDTPRSISRIWRHTVRTGGHGL